MKNWKHEWKWAIIFTVMMILWMIMEVSLGYHHEKIAQHAIVTNLVAIPAITIFVLAFLQKRKTILNGKMTYMDGVKSGLVMSIIIMLFTPIMQYITATVISPDYFQNMIDFSVEQNIYTQVEAESFFNLKMFVVSSTIGSLIMGIVTSAIVAIFTRKS
ncbi:MAG: hypothetical protein ACI9XP_000208 [Lentimonas sp.]|jgi:hypothetical protein